MNIQLTATGTPGQVTTDLAQQIKAARDGNPGSWPALAPLRDYIAERIRTAVDEQGAKATKKITVQVNVTVSILAGDEAAEAEGTVLTPKAAKRVRTKAAQKRAAPKSPSARRRKATKTASTTSTATVTE